MNDLVKPYPGFENLIKNIEVEMSYTMPGKGIVRGVYDYESGTLKVFCIRYKVCVETLIHEILHSNRKTKRRGIFDEGLTELFTLYYLKKFLPQCIDHRLTDALCMINKEYEYYVRLWGSIALEVGIERLWKYYTRGNDELLDEIETKENLFESEKLVQQKLKIKIYDLIDILDKL
ncbi:hypothetical protein Saci_2004 [Sulfolobus acidocaldarius DSM 639]|uniref:Uncharacterized protein n=4 Tax=Sulfolobus acidocaldarius TaxID=2285 RepID=Q4J7C3_SULAC|nr:hypothetical protein Saci_2004 [Sulfolobus acidocaldarius DSM 639]